MGSSKVYMFEIKIIDLKKNIYLIILRSLTKDLNTFFQYIQIFITSNCILQKKIIILINEWMFQT